MPRAMPELEITESERYADLLDYAAKAVDDTTKSSVDRIRRLAAPEQDGTILLCRICSEELEERAALGKVFCLPCQVQREKKQ